MGEPQRKVDQQAAGEADEIVVDLDDWKDATRYRRQSGALPRLSDDPGYSPNSHALPHPVKEPTGFFARLKAKVTR